MDGGAPEGDRAKLPAAPQFADGWQIGTRDIIIEMPEPFEVPAEGTIDYQYIQVATNFTEDKWVRAVELRAGVRPAVHHIILYIVDEEGAPQEKAFKDIPVGPEAEAAFEEARQRAEEDGGDGRQGPGRILASLAPGMNPVVFEPGTALRIPKGAQLLFNMHYTGTGETTLDQSKVGLFLADGPPEREVRADQFLNMSFELPPGAPNERVDSMIEVHRGRRDLRAVAAYASAWQGVGVRDHLPGRADRAAALGAELRLQLADLLHVQGAFAGAEGHHDRGVGLV